MQQLLLMEVAPDLVHLKQHASELRMLLILSLRESLHGVEVNGTSARACQAKVQRGMGTVRHVEL